MSCWVRNFRAPARIAAGAGVVFAFVMALALTAPAAPGSPEAATPTGAPPAPEVPIVVGAGGARLAPNPRGEVMILVYHRFGPRDSRWTRAYSSFDKDLERLDAGGYRPITLWQYVSGDFRLPAGLSPVVITFDDGSDNQVKFAAAGELAPDCALAHWLAFTKTHPEFPMRGVFFVNPGMGGRDAFAQPRFALAKMRMILKLGGEIGNHTLTHANLRRQAAIAAREIGLGQYYLERDLPGYTVHSFALPFGIYPNPQSLAWAGTWRNPRSGAPAEQSWRYADVVKVGAGPAESSLVAGFDPLHLPRIQVFDPEIDHWLEYFQRHPGRRFVSDGEEHAAGSLSPAARARRGGLSGAGGSGAVRPGAARQSQARVARRAPLARAAQAARPPRGERS